MEDTTRIKHCEKCNKTFTSNAHYLIHCETELHKTGHRKTRNDRQDDLTCNLCHIYKTKQKSTMLIHVLNNHSNQKTKKSNFKFYCETCDYGIINETKFNQHLSTTKHKIKSAAPIN